MTSLDPPPHPKRLRFGNERPSILDTPGSQHYNAALDIALDSQLPETIEDVSQTPAPMQARVDWNMMSANTPPHINMLPSASQFSEIPPAQYDPTQIDTQTPAYIHTQRDDLTPTQPVSQTQVTEYSDHWDEFFLPSIPEGVPVHHISSDSGRPISVNTSSPEDSAFFELFYDTANTTAFTCEA